LDEGEYSGAGAKKVATMLERAKKLSYISFEDNNIGSEGALLHFGENGAVEGRSTGVF
jgi:hypothetical protein